MLLHLFFMYANSSKISLHFIVYPIKLLFWRQKLIDNNPAKWPGKAIQREDTPCPTAPAGVHQGAPRVAPVKFLLVFSTPVHFLWELYIPREFSKKVDATPLKFWKVTPAVSQQYSITEVQQYNSTAVQQYSSTAAPQQYNWLFTCTPVRFSFLLTPGCTPPHI